MLVFAILIAIIIVVERDTNIVTNCNAKLIFEFAWNEKRLIIKRFFVWFNDDDIFKFSFDEIVFDQSIDENVLINANDTSQIFFVSRHDRRSRFVKVNFHDANAICIYDEI